jgi:hypothetical protein
LRVSRQGATDHGHRITSAIACHLARLGGTAEQLVQLLMHPDHEGGRHAQTIALRSGHARARDYVHRVWASASAVVSDTAALDSRHHAHQDLAALREKIETTPWHGQRGRTALRILRAHLTFAEIAGGRMHAASERQVAEEAGISRQTLRNAYEAVLWPRGWLRRLRVGHGREGSTWYLDNGPNCGGTWVSHHRTTQCPPNLALEEWSTDETAVTASIDSTVIQALMAHDAFAHHSLGSSALMVIAALHHRPGQTVTEVIATSSVSRATVYRTLRRLAAYGLVHKVGETWTLAPRALEGIGHSSSPEAAGSPDVVPSQGWDAVAQHCGTQGIAALRRAQHAAERAAYRAVLDQRAEHRNKAVVIIRDGHHVLVPTPRADEIPPNLLGPHGQVLDPVTGRIDPQWRIATDRRLILITSRDQRTYDELAAAYAETLREWESA